MAAREAARAVAASGQSIVVASSAASSASQVLSGAPCHVRAAAQRWLQAKRREEAEVGATHSTQPANAARGRRSGSAAARIGAQTAHVELLKAALRLRPQPTLVSGDLEKTIGRCLRAALR